MRNQNMKINVGLAVVIVLCSLEYIEGNKLNECSWNVVNATRICRVTILNLIIVICLNIAIYANMLFSLGLFISKY